MHTTALSLALRHSRGTLASLLASAGLAACALPSAAPPQAAGVIATNTATPTTAAITATATSANPNAENTRQLHMLFDSAWEQAMQRHPQWATYLGDRRYGDKLDDASAEAEAAGYAETRRQQMAALAIPRAGLSATDATSLDLFLHQLDDTLRFKPLVGYRRLSLGAIGGFHTDFNELQQASPMDSRAAAEQMLARLAAYPRRVDQELVRLRQGIALGWVAPHAVLDRVLTSLDAQLAAVADASPFFLPFTMLGPDIPPAEQALLRSQAQQVIAAEVLPAQRRLRAFIAGDYSAAAPASGAMSSYPGGAAVYAAAVRQQTTTDLSPAQIHAIGLREVARLDREIAQVMAELKWTGPFVGPTGFAQHMLTDPKYFHPSPEALLASYRDIAKRIDAELPKLFAELPRAPYGVRAMPAHESPDRAEYYSSPALDGSRPGWFNANAQGYKTRPTWGQETLTAHEAVPGHHLQTARAAELGELPKFRRAAWYVAYGEGWALYAETLGFELGLYKDPASRYGHLQDQMLRACRLVVDTGLHSLGWSPRRAADYMTEHGGQERGFIESEVDRYLSDPGQALGYMIGQLKIIELRDRARARLGERFDIRRFHMVLLDQGAVPLSVLERLVDGWIAAEAAKS